MKADHLYCARIVYCVCLLILPFNIAYCSATTEPQRPVNIIMLLDSNSCADREEVQQGQYCAVTGRLHEALIQCDREKPAIIITTPALLYALTVLYQADPTKDDFAVIAKGWNLYLHIERFLNYPAYVVLIPKVLAPMSLEELGLSNNLKVIPPNDILPTFQQKKYSITTNLPHHLKNLFNSPIQPPKRIYMAGHGYNGLTIANTFFRDYQEHLQILNSKNVEVLYIASCLAGGINMLTGHNLLKEEGNQLQNFSLETINFPIIIGCVTGTVQFRENTDNFFCNFFNAADRFLLEKTTDYRMAATTFAQALYNIMPYRTNIPLFRNTAKSIFRAMPLQNTYVLTFPALQITKKAEARRPILTIDQQKTSLLVYPVALDGITIQLAETPLFVSMIPGIAQHYIEHIQKSDITYLQSISNMFCKPIAANGPIPYHSLDAKAWFIEKFTDKNATILGLVIHKTETCIEDKALFIVLYQIYEKYYRYVTNSILGIGTRQEIAQQAYCDEIFKINAQTRAKPEAITFATAGKESCERELMAFQHFAATCMPSQLHRIAPIPVESAATLLQPAPAPSPQQKQPATFATAPGPIKQSPVKTTQLAHVAAVYKFTSNKKPSKITKK